MTSTSITTVAMPDSALEHIREIERLGFKYQYHPQFDISLLDLAKRRVQVRQSEHYAPPSGVKQFAESMKGGRIFPPVVITKDNFIVDGNTRVEASRANKSPYFHGLVLNAHFEGADSTTQNKLVALAATLNQLNGERLTTAEAKSAATVLLELGWSLPNIQRALGLTSGTVNKIRREQEALARITQLGMIPPANAYLANAGSKAMLALNDEPYRRLLLLMTDANLTAREVRALAEEAKKAGSDQAAVDLIQKTRAEMEQRILDNALTGNGKPSRAALFRQALGRVLGYEGSEHEVVERSTDLELRKQHSEQLRRAVLVLENVIARQKELLDV